MLTYDNTVKASLSKQYEMYPDSSNQALWHSIVMAGHVRTLPGWGIQGSTFGFLLQLILKGRGWIRTQERRFTVGPGSVIFLDRYLPYEQGVDPNDPWEVYWIAFETGVAHHWIEALRCDEHPVIRPRHWKRCVQHFERFLSLMRRKPSGYAGQLFVTLNNINADLYSERVVTNPTPSKAASADPNYTVLPNLPVAVRRAVELLHGTTQKGVTIDALVQHSRAGRSHLYRLFEKHLGVSPMEFMRRHRMQRAKDLLRHTNLAIKDISYQIGMEDVSHFSRLFRQSVGKTPREYRMETNRLWRFHHSEDRARRTNNSKRTSKR